jgi:hypothetical protein
MITDCFATIANLAAVKPMEAAILWVIALGNGGILIGVENGRDQLPFDLPRSDGVPNNGTKTIRNNHAKTIASNNGKGNQRPSAAATANRMTGGSR